MRCSEVARCARGLAPQVEDNPAPPAGRHRAQHRGESVTRPCTCSCSVPWEVARAARGMIEAGSVLALPRGLKERGRRETRHDPFWWRCVGLPGSVAETLFARLPN